MPLSQLLKSSPGESKPELQLLLNVVTESLCGLDTAGNVTFCNEALLRMTQYKTGEIIGKNLDELLHHSSPNETTNASRECTLSKVLDCHREIHIVGELFWRKDGTCFPAEYWSHRLHLASSGTECVLTIYDITERRCTEEKLGRSQYYLAESQRLTHIGSWAWRTDQPESVFWSTEHYRIFGMEPGSGRMGFEESMERLHPEDALIFRGLVKESIAKKKDFQTELRIILPDGSIRNVHGSGRPIIDEAGNVVEFVGTTTDVTDRKRAEKQLRLAQFSLEHTSGAVHWVDSNGRFVYVNAEACSSLGRSREELLSLSIPDIAPLRTKETWKTFWQELKARGSMCFETKNKSKQERVFPVEVNATYLQFDGEEYAFAFVCNIAERKKAEETLRLMQVSLEHASDAVFWVNSEARIVYVNQASCRSLERSREELLALSIPDIDPFYTNDRWQGFWQELTTQGTMRFETQHRTKQGRDFPVEVNANYIKLDGKDYSFCFTRDITERKRAEEDVRESNELVRLVLDSVPEAVYGIDLHGKCTFCNPACLRLLGYEEPADLYGKDMHELIHHSRPDGTPYPVEECHIYEAFRRGHGTHIDTEVLWCRDGASFSAEYWSHPIHRDGNVIGTVVTFVNITERKQVEQTIRESEKRYRLLFERNLAGVFRTTMEGQILECNQAAAHMFGYNSPKEILATPITDIYQMISDRGAFLRRLKSEKSLTNHETNYRRKNGESAWAMINATLVDDDSGTVSFIEGTFVDITERKVAEERVQSLAYFDALTGLPNRTLLRDRLSLALAGVYCEPSSRSPSSVAKSFLAEQFCKFSSSTLCITLY